MLPALLLRIRSRANRLPGFLEADFRVVAMTDEYAGCSGYLTSTVMELTRGKARVYNRRTGAHGAGHVGWAFLDEQGFWDAGAVERGGLVTPPGKSDRKSVV